MLNLRGIDLNLLPVFEAAYEEPTLSSAAERLAMTQSAVSHSLTRLRAVFNDELFVRSGRGVVRTPTADAIYARVHGALSTVRESISETRGFDPKTSTRSFFISVSHPLGPLMAVRLREQLQVAAPGIKVSFTTRSRPIELDQALRDGRVDAAVDWLLPGRGQFKETALFEDAMVAVARRGHPAIQKVRMVTELNTLEFVSLRPRVEGESPVPGIQEWLRLKPNIVLEVSELLEVLMVASQSDLVGLIPRSMLKLARDTLELRSLPVAGTSKTIPIRLVWAANKDSDAAQVFIRKQIGLASRGVAGRGLH
jgi:LysR family transcriptional regulator, transcriptional activator for leuABCD operon